MIYLIGIILFFGLLTWAATSNTDSDGEAISCLFAVVMLPTIGLALLFLFFLFNW